MIFTFVCVIIFLFCKFVSSRKIRTMAVLLTIVFLVLNPISNTYLALNTYYLKEKKEARNCHLFIYTEKYSAILKFFIFLYYSVLSIFEDSGCLLSPTPCKNLAFTNEPISLTPMLISVTFSLLSQRQVYYGILKAFLNNLPCEIGSNVLICLSVEN